MCGIELMLQLKCFGSLGLRLGAGGGRRMEGGELAGGKENILTRKFSFLLSYSLCPFILAKKSTLSPAHSTVPPPHPGLFSNRF